MVLQLFLMPACFLVVGVVGWRLGTPERVAAGLVWVGTTHIVAFTAALAAPEVGGSTAAWIEVAAQILFVSGFGGFVWLASVYPDSRPSRLLVGTAATLAVVGPTIAAVSGPISVLDGEQKFGPLIHLLPLSAARAADSSMLAMPLLAVVTFSVRYKRAGHADRIAMRWPVAGVAVIAVLALSGSLLGDERQDVVAVAFFLIAPIFPLAVAFGPVVRRIDAMADDITTLSRKLHLRPPAPPGVLARLTPRELSVLVEMAEGKSNPQIAMTLHLSLSSVEKHVTSIFRKFDISAGPETHRRVAAVVLYRDARETLAE